MKIYIWLINQVDKLIEIVFTGQDLKFIFFFQMNRERENRN